MLSRKFSNCQLWKKPEISKVKPVIKTKKVQRRNQTCIEEKENQQNIANCQLSTTTVDVTKKIKKLSHKKVQLQRISFYEPSPSRINGYPVYPESALGFDRQFASLIQPQRIDNDVDTDEEQIYSGIRKLQRFLTQSIHNELAVKQSQTDKKEIKQE